MRIVVIGGGVVGTTSAYCLAQDGHQVVLVERNSELAAECSFANGAMLHASHGEPWNSPAALRQLLTWMGREDSPLLMRPRQLPRMLRWGLAFLAHSRRRHHRWATLANTRLARYSQAVMAEIRERTGLRYDDTHDGICKLFWSDAEMDAALATSEMIAELGVPYDTWDRDTLIAREPALKPVAEKLAGAIHYPEDESGDPAVFTRGLGRAAMVLGVSVHTGTRVTGFHAEGRRLTGVETDNGTQPADAVVLATGAEAPLLGRELGLRLPIEPVKGYSITLTPEEPAAFPRLPLIDDGHKVVMTPLGQRLRVAGTAEFTGLDTRVNPRRIELLLHQLGQVMPQLAGAVQTMPRTEWACLRAMTPDGPPILDQGPLDNLWLNVGAGHMGWTFAAGLGALLRDRMAGRSPAIDPTPYRLDRGAGRR